MPTTAITSPSVANTVSQSSSNIPVGTDWQTALLDFIGAPATPQNYQFLNGWFEAEHGHELGTLYANNPFFTTAGGGGSAGPIKPGTYPTIPNVNNGTIPEYPSVAVGVFATGETLQQYPTIVSALKSGNPSSYYSNSQFQQELNTWGSGFSSVSSLARTAPSAPTAPGIESALPSNSAGIFASGSPPPAAEKAIEGAASAVGGAVSDAASVSKFLGDLTSANFWIRALEMIAGFALVGLGLYLTLKDFGVSTPTLPGPADKAAKELDALKIEASTAQAQARIAEGQSRQVTAQTRQENYPTVYAERVKQARAQTSKQRADARSARSGATEAKRRAERARTVEREQIYGMGMFQ